MYVIDDDKLREKFDKLLQKNRNPSNGCDLTRFLKELRLDVKSEISESIMINGPLYPLIVICKGILALSVIDSTSVLKLLHENDCFYFDLSYLELNDHTLIKHDEYIKLFEAKYGIKVNAKFFIKEKMNVGDCFNRRVYLEFKTATLKNYKEFN